MDLSEARARLDRIDKGMLELFGHRMEVISQIADYKEKNNLPLRDKAREQVIIASVAEQVHPEIATYAGKFMEAIIESSCDYQTDRRKKMGKNG